MEPWEEAFARANFLRSADTAHDLKTPLNVAVLNLELLRMRIAKIGQGSKDEKITGYAAAIETELRRMAQIFDAFFLLSTPPKGEGDPASIDIAPICMEIAAPSGLNLRVHAPVVVRAHAPRIREALKMFFEGATKVLKTGGRNVSAESTARWFHIAVSGQADADDFDLSKIFKFYYTDPAGNPDLSLAGARLIAETYGGNLDATQEHDKVTLRLSLPLGDQ